MIKIKIVFVKPCQPRPRFDHNHFLYRVIFIPLIPATPPLDSMSMLPQPTDYNGKILLVRADLNLPMKNGQITDSTRLTRFLPSIKIWQDGGAKKIVILSHLGRPDGKKNMADSLQPVANEMARLLGQDVAFLPDCVGAATLAQLDQTPARVVMAENLRFHAGEEANDEAFAQQLARLGDVFINDAFSVSHRRHASVAAITQFLPSYAGPSLVAEVEALERVLVKPARPVMAIIGGAKISTKIGIIEFLLPRLDQLVIGGAMANSFLLARGVSVGASLVEKNHLPLAEKIMAAAERQQCRLHLPLDYQVTTKLEKGATNYIKTTSDNLSADELIADIGPATTTVIGQVLQGVTTLLWNGPLGAFETPPFDRGTVAVARQVAALTTAGAMVSVAGGGDTAAALAAAGVEEKFSYLSTAGGAFLEWLEGKKLPAIAALERK